MYIISTWLSPVTILYCPASNYLLEAATQMPKRLLDLTDLRGPSVKSKLALTKLRCLTLLTAMDTVLATPPYILAVLLLGQNSLDTVQAQVPTIQYLDLL